MKYTLQKEHGTALITALVLLVALTMIALSSAKSTSVQLIISGNDEVTVEAYEYAQSIVDAVTETPTNFKMGTSIGYTSCLKTETGCNNDAINFTEPMFSGLNLQAKVTFLKSGPAPRKHNASSASQTSGAYFDITGQYDMTANKRGKANISQGYVLIVPTGQ